MSKTFLEMLEKAEEIAWVKIDPSLFSMVILLRRCYTGLLMEEIGIYQKQVEFLKKINEEITKDALESRAVIASLKCGKGERK